MIRLNSSSPLSSRTVAEKPDPERMRLVLAALLTSDLNKEIDAICRERLSVDICRISVGYTTLVAVYYFYSVDASINFIVGRKQSSTLYSEQNLQGPWSISPDISASRSLALVAVLQTLLHLEGMCRTKGMPLDECLLRHRRISVGCEHGHHVLCNVFD